MGLDEEFLGVIDGAVDAEASTALDQAIVNLREYAATLDHTPTVREVVALLARENRARGLTLGVLAAALLRLSGLSQ